MEAAEAESTQEEVGSAQEIQFLQSDLVMSPELTSNLVENGTPTKKRLSDLNQWLAYENPVMHDCDRR